MANMQHKPVPHSPAAAKPVADARARALQEQIRVLREQARQAGDRLLQAPERIRERLQAEWEQAEQACREAEARMARLRAEALGAAPAARPAVERQHPASPLPEDALQRLIFPDTPRARLTPVTLDADPGWDRNQAANVALGLLQRASEPLLNSPILEQGLLQPSDTTLVQATSIDFGPLVDEAPAAPVRRQPAPKGKAAPVTAAIPRPAVVAAKPATQSVQRPAPRPQTHTAVPARRPVVAAPARRVKSRSGFTTALLVGAVLGGLIVLALAWFRPLSPWQADPQRQGSLQETGLHADQSLRLHWIPGARG